MLQSSLKPGLLFQRCNSSYVTRLPVIWRTVSSAERQYVPRTSTSTPSTAKTKISGRSFFFIFFRVSPAIVGFPVNARGMHARAGEKSKKQDITRAELENSMRNEIKETQGIAGKKNAAPVLRTGFLLVRHSGCGGV